MAALDFPTSPSVGQTYTTGGRSWRWDGTTWVSQSNVTQVSSLPLHFLSGFGD